MLSKNLNKFANIYAFVGCPPCPRKCALIESKVPNFELRFGDFSEIDTRGGARD